MLVSFSIRFVASAAKHKGFSASADTLKAVERAPWTDPADPIEGVILYEQVGGHPPS
jgi:hypothetical protein